MTTDSFATQAWNASGGLDTPAYCVSRVTFDSQGSKVVGNLFLPHAARSEAAVVIVGPVGFVKEQAPIQYATRLATAGLPTLIFDPRHHGESEGLPRRLEDPVAKTQDISAAVGFLERQPDIAPRRIGVVGICQGVNWTIEAARRDPRIAAIALVAGHYLTPEVARLYLGGQEAVDARLSKSATAARRYRESGEVDYIPIVAPGAAPASDALLAAPFIRSFYLPWADRHPMLSHRGLWENRIPAMSEGAIWSHRIDLAARDLNLPVLMLHADRAASGPDVPRRIFEAIPSPRKTLIWLGAQGQIQFYEDPLTIDQVIPHLASFLGSAVEARPEEF